jgi:hypothetical protein
VRITASLLAASLLASCTNGGSNPSPMTGPTSVAPAASSPGKPAMRITSPHTGDRVELPATVQYEVDAPPPGAVIRLFPTASPTGAHRDYSVEGPRGGITLPDDKMLTGYRSLTFCLASGEHLIDNTCQTLHLLLIGRK